MKKLIAKIILKYHRFIDLFFYITPLVLLLIFDIIFETSYRHLIRIFIALCTILITVKEFDISNFVDPKAPIRDFLIRIYFKNWTMRDLDDLNLSFDDLCDYFGLGGFKKLNENHIFYQYFILKSKNFVQNISDKNTWISRNKAPVRYTIPHMILEKSFFDKKPCFTFKLFIEDHPNFNDFIEKNPEMRQYIIS